jgi:alcohol dehydrogenase YqhD (iron-dependent ADH family)
MLDFTFHNPTKIFFGKGMVSGIGAEIKKYSDRILLVYGKGSVKKTGIYDDVVDELKKSSIEWFELAGVDPNPRIESVNQGAKLCREHSLGLVLAVGGGSSIDCAKGIAAATLYNGDPWDFYEKKATIKEALPVGTVLTLSATGSEMNGNSVVSNMAIEEKKGAGSPLLMPKFSVLDPQYTFSVPKYHTAAGTVDIMTHVYEFYFNQVKTDFLQARLSEAIMKTCVRYGEVAINEPDNYEARANLMWASTMALNGVIKCGAMFDGFSHRVEHAVSAIYDLTHGAGLAIISPHWLEYILDESTVDRIYEFAVNVWGIEGDDKFQVAKAGIARTKEYYKKLGMPVTFSDAGIDDSRFEDIADKSAGILSHSFKKLNREDVMNILKSAK